MKKDDNRKPIEEMLKDSRVEKVEVVGEMKKSFISYAMAVNVSRAIPDVRDGLKPVHRRILFSMSELNNTHDKPYKKCAKTVGEVIGNYHPHGDSSIYMALVRMAQDFSIREKLVDGHGNFGSVDGDPPAAYRYTEARLSKISSLMLEDIEKETVDFYPNFDETREQPKVLPAKFPNLLVNGADGIAVGMATNIPPHNLAEVINGVQALIDNPEIDIDELCEIIPAPDFPTGGIIMGRSNIKHAYKTGKGGVVVRGRAEIEESSSGKMRIIITELPYQVNKANFVIQMADLVKNKKLEGISDIREESDRDGMRVVVEIKRDANAQVVLNSLYKHTQLQQGSGIILLALVDDQPKVMNLKEMLYHYLEHQKDVLVRKTKFDLRKTEERAHIVTGLVIAQSQIDEIIKTIKQSVDKQDALNKLVSNFELDEIQANAILEMKLSRLTGLEMGRLKTELTELEARILDLKDILERPARVLQIIRDGLEEVKNTFGNPRKTEISLEIGGIDIADLIAKEDVIISMTHQGYIKRMSVDEYKSQKRGGVGVTGHKTKEEDFVERIFTTSTHDDILFFTTNGKVYTIKGYEIPEAQKTAKGRSIINLIQLENDEKVSAIVPRKESDEGFFVMATRKGLIKKTALKEFDSIRKTGKIAISLQEGDELIEVEIANENQDILIASSVGKCIRFSEKDVRKTGRESQGVKSMEIKEDDFIIDMTIIKPESQIVTITENGYGKRSSTEDYRQQKRAGQGVKAGIFNEKTGRLVALKQTSGDEDIMMVTNTGIIIRTPLEDISTISRVSQGVRVMKLREDTKLVSVALVIKDEEDESQAEENNETTENVVVESENTIKDN